MIISAGKTGEVYNVGSGNAVKIEDVLKIILKNTKKNIIVMTDESKFRPIDIPKIEPDNLKLCNLGWKPQYDVNESIVSILEYFRNKI